MAGFFIFLVIFTAGILQITFFPNNFAIGKTPDLILILIIFWTAIFGFEESWKKIFLAGLILDIVSSNIFGINILSLTLVAFGVSFVTRRFLVGRRVLGFLIILGLVILGTVVNIFILDALDKLYHLITGKSSGITVINFFQSGIFIKIFLNVAVFSIIYVPLFKLENFILFIKSRQRRTI